MADIATVGFKADTSGLVKAEQGLDRVTSAGKRTDSSLSALQKTVGIVGTALAAIGSTALASQLTKYADTATNIENRLRTVTSSTEQLASAQERLLKIANASRSEYQTTAELYTKLSQSTKELGLSSERLFRITETINKSFAASGASSIEASNAIRQLAQGLSAGALRGDEFNSVAEQAPEILRAVATATGKTVGELREFAAQGGITAELLIASLENYGDTVDKVYGKTNATLEQSRTIAANNVIEWVGGNKTIMAATAALGSAMVTASQNLDAVSSAIQAAAAVVGAAMLPALAKYVTGLYAAATATGALATATSFLLGPWGLLIAAVGAGATAFYLTSSAQKEMAETTKILDSDIDKLTTSMEGMTKAQRDSLSLDINKRLMDIKAEKDALEELVVTRKAIAGFSNEEVSEFGNLIGVAGLNTETLAAAATHGEAKIDELDARAAELNATLEKMAEMGGNAGKQIINIGESAKETAKRLKDLEERMQDRFDGEDELVEIEKERMRIHDELMDNWSEGVDIYGEGAEKMATLSEKAAERIEQAFSDAWVNAFDGFESVVDGMKNAFKRMLAEMAHMALTRPIMVSLGMGGMLPGTANAGGLGGLSSGLGLLGGIGGGLTGIGGMLGGAFGGGLAGAGGLISAGNIGGLFSGAGSLLGSGNIAAGLGMSMPIIAAAVVAAMGINKLAGGGLFGTSFKTDSQSLGLSLGGGDVSGLITTEESRKKSLFRGTKRRTSTSDFDASAIDSAFDSITNALSVAANAFGITGADEIIKGFSAAANINIKDKTEQEVQAAIQEWIGSTTEGLVNAVFGNSLDGLQKEGEGAIDTVNRLSMNMGAVQAITKTLGLDFDLTGKAAMIASTNIVELAGGIDQLAALSTQYYQSFYSETERQSLLTEQLTAEFAKLNIALPTSRDGFRSIVDGIDLTTESGQKLFASLMQLVPGLDQQLSAIEALTSASEQAAQAALKEAEAKAAAIKAQGLDLQLRLYDALGQSSEALAMRRQMEIAATDESLRAMLLQIYAAQDAATAQRELAAAQNAAADSARDMAQSAFSKLEQSAQIEKDRLSTELDLKLSAIDKERDALTAQRDSVIAGYREQGQAVNAYIQKLEGLSGVINDFLGQTGAAADPFKRLGQIFNEVKAGLLPEQSDLQSALSGIAGAGTSGFGSASDASFAMAVARNQASEIGKMVGGRASGARSQSQLIEQQIVDAEKYFTDEMMKLDLAAELAQKLHDEQVVKIDEQLSEAQKQLNALLGVDDRILTMSEAAAEFYAALADANELSLSIEQQQLDAINNVSASIAGLGAQLVELNKPLDRIWIPPVNEQKPMTQEVSAEMVELLKELVAASDATAKHTKTTANVLELNQYEAQEAAV